MVRMVVTVAMVTVRLAWLVVDTAMVVVMVAAMVEVSGKKTLTL